MNPFSRKLEPVPTAADNLKAGLAEYAAVKAQESKLHTEMAARQHAGNDLAAARQRVAELVDADRAARALHSVEGTADTERQNREAVIVEAQRIAKDLAAKSDTADVELRLLADKLAPLTARLQDIDARLRGLERDALIETLDAAAADHQRAHDAFLSSTRKVFALSYAVHARGGAVGAGLEAHLVMPHPETPAFKDCEIPRGFRVAIEIEAQRILRELRA